jgi:hypothetical protein
MIIAACSAALFLQGCATASKDLTASYVSPLQYQSYDCDQLRAEAQRIQTRVVQLGGRLDEAANNDKGIMAVGLIIFWPALFALGGTKAQEAEYSRLKGEYDALEEQAVIKKCPGIAPPTSSVTTAAAPAPATPAVAVAPAASSPVLNAAPMVPPPPAEVVPQRSAQPAPAGPLPPGAVAVQPVGLKSTSKHMFSAERFAKETGCASPVASMSLQRPESETFTITCASGEAMIVRCDGSACRALR